MSEGLQAVDLLSGGRPRAIASWMVDDEILVDPGPALTAPRLVDLLGGWRPRAIALTHIHLDHAGATGTLVARWPECQVWVHERGARHLSDPSRLIASAERIYGDGLEGLWGLPEPVRPEAIRPLGDGATIGPFRAAETPGHARHHLVYLHEDTGTAFAGDLAGIRIPPSDLILMPTVPPEFDPVAWRRSLRRLEELAPARLALPHFGLWENGPEHLSAAAQALDRWTRAGRDLDEEEFTGALGQAIAASGDPDTGAAYEQACQPQILWPGARAYWDAQAP